MSPDARLGRRLWLLFTQTVALGCLFGMRSAFGGSPEARRMGDAHAFLGAEQIGNDARRRLALAPRRGPQPRLGWGARVEPECAPPHARGHTPTTTHALLRCDQDWVDFVHAGIPELRNASDEAVERLTGIEHAFANGKFRDELLPEDVPEGDLALLDVDASRWRKTDPSRFPRRYPCVCVYLIDPHRTDPSGKGLTLIDFIYPEEFGA